MTTRHHIDWVLAIKEIGLSLKNKKTKKKWGYPTKAATQREITKKKKKCHHHES